MTILAYDTGKTASPAVGAKRSDSPNGGAVRSLGRHANNAVASLKLGSDDPRVKLYGARIKSADWLKDLYNAGLPPKGFIHVEGDEWVNPETGEVATYAYVKKPRPATCSHAVGETVSINNKAGKAHYGGVESCASIWSCPVCASHIRAQRAIEIARVVEAHQAQGGAVLFMTLTVRHHKQDKLKTLLDTVSEGWRALTGSRVWRKRVKKDFGIDGYIRSIEITYGENGWHPHVHTLLFLKDDLSLPSMEKLGSEIFNFWSDWAQKQLGKAPTRDHGLDLQKVDDKGKVLSKYLSKFELEKTDKWSVDREMARSDMKKGRKTSITSFQLLTGDTVLGLAEGKRRSLWIEYYEATKGGRCITWSRGLKDRYGITDKTDEEIIEDVQAGGAVWVAHRKDYEAINKDPEKRARAQFLAEIQDWKQLARLLPGHRVEAELSVVVQLSLDRRLADLRIC